MATTPRLRALPALPLLLSAVTLAGCGAVEERIDDAATDVLDNAIEQEADRRLADAGVQLSEPVDCSTDGDVDLGSLSGDIVTDCSATTADGLPVSASFDGVLGVDGCDGVLTLVAGDQQIYDGPVTSSDCAG